MYGFPTQQQMPNYFYPQGQQSGSPIPQGNLAGIGQIFNHFNQYGQGNRFNLMTDGVARLFLQGLANPFLPLNYRGAGGRNVTPLGIFETGVGWKGGNANAGVLGTQASGMAWSMSRNPVNPSMITSYSNPYYSKHNFNSGFFSA